jgi:Outer membrane protein beta-barrel domain
MKAWRFWLAGALTVVVVGSVVARPASAEWFLDFYGGGAFTQDADVKLRGGTTLDDQVEFDTEATGGGRLGYWFSAIGLPWLGVALDVSYFAPKASGTTIDTRLEVIPISSLAMFRAPLLASPAFPFGQLQPYIGAGPSLFIADVKIDSPLTGERRSDAQAEVGGDLRGGITFLFTPNFGVFAEGRYTFFRTNPGGQNTEFDVETFHALGGLTLRW